MSSRAQFLWIGGSLSTLERLALRSYVAHGYDVDLYSYEPVAGVPDGVRRCVGEDILPRDRIFTVSKGWGAGSFANFADLFRYHLLRLKGGWWFDLDIVALRRLPDPSGLWLASSFEGRHGQLPNNCAMHAEPGNAVIERLCAEAESEMQRAPELGFGQIGPYLLQRVVRELGLGAHVAPWWEFSPYPHEQIARVAFSPGLRPLVREGLRRVKYRWREAVDRDFRAGRVHLGTRGLHLHNELWRAGGWNKDARYHRLCLYERLKRRYGE